MAKMSDQACASSGNATRNKRTRTAKPAAFEADELEALESAEEMMQEANQDYREAKAQMIDAMND